MEGRRASFVFAGLVAALAGKALLAGFVLPYELRVGPVSKPDRYTVLVFLPEHYRKQWGPTDDLWRLLPRNDHGRENRFARAYLPFVYQWYLEQIRAHPELYGEDTDPMLAALQTHHGIDVEGGAVVFTEHGNLRKPLGLLRVSGPDAEGLLATNRQFLGELNGKRFPERRARFAWNRIARFLAEPGTNAFDVTRAQEVQPHLWPEGRNVEFKNFAMEPALRGRLMRYLFQILWSHQLFAFSDGAVPDALNAWPDGTPLDAADRAAMGLRVSDIWLGTYGKVLMRFYRTLGFRVWRELNLPQWKKPIFLMRATVRNYGRYVRGMKPGALRDFRYLLVEDAATSRRLHEIRCLEEIASVLAP